MAALSPSPKSPATVPTPGPAPGPVPQETAPAPVSKSMNTAITVGGTLLSCILLIIGISIEKHTAASGAGPRVPPKWATKGFEGLAILGKGGLIAVLIALATMNGNVSYVAQNPTKFMQDALATAGSGALAAVWLTATRGRTDLFLNHLIFAFMLFFLYHVCRELAGYFTIFGSEKPTDKIQKEKSKFTKPVLIAGGALAFIAIVLALISRASPDYGSGILKSFGSATALGIETLIFVAIVTAGEVIVAKNHGDPIGPAIGTSALIFTLAHLVLQAGGFYDHLYKTTHAVANTVANAKLHSN